jgi:N-acetylneuraminic acid mutarotase
MKGDFSRISFDPKRHYTRVLQQQGRVQTDSDWNEQGDIAAHHRDTSLRDVIGRVGVPRDDAGFGIRGLCGLRFDGANHYLEVRADLPLRFNGEDYTVEGWIKLEGERRGATLISRFDHEWNGELAGGFRLGVSPHGRLRFDRMVLRERIEHIELDADVWGDLAEEDIVIAVESRARVRLAGKRLLPVDRFCHVAAVCEGGWIRLYVDGVLDAESDGGEGAPFESMPVFVGCHPVRDRLARHFRGVIDQLRIWRRGLDEAGVRAAMQGGVRRNAPDLAFHWDFDGKHGRAGNAEHMPEPAEPEIWIGAGRCYVEGVLCENEADVRYEHQPDCPGSALPDTERHPGPYLAWLDSWDRVVSAIEDETILEPALGGPDTAMRLRTVSQVRLLPLPEGAEAALPPLPPPGTLMMTPTPGMSYQDNSLVRIEIHDPGVAGGGPMPSDDDPGPGYDVIGIDADRNRIIIAQPPGETRVWARDQLVELVRAGLDAALTATISAAEDEGVSGQRTLELSDVPQGDSDPALWRLRPIATFKWSRDNGAWAFSVASIDWNADTAQMTVTVTDPNRMRSMLSENDWVELVDDDTALLGQAGPLCRIKAIAEGDENGFTVALDRPGTDPLRRSPEARVARHASLRRWDGIHAATRGALGVKAIAAMKSIQLDGVAVEFSAGHYAGGDYWVAPLRQRVQWPKDRNGKPIAMPPHGIRRRRAELALVWFKQASVEVHDLRPVFAPATEESGSRPALPAHDGAEVLEREGVEDARLMQDFGLVPPDYCILGPSEEPPIGWRYTGVRFARRREDPAWIELDPPLPEAGPAIAAALHGKVFCLREHGDFFSIDPREMHARTACRKPEGANFTGASLASLNGKLHLLGGFDADGNPTDRHSQYDPALDTWKDLAPLPTPRGMIATAVLGGNLIAVGGARTQWPHPVKAVDCYRPAIDNWVEWPSLPHGRAAGAATAHGGRLYLFGGLVRCLFGLRARATHKVLVYSPRTEQWCKGARLQTAQSGAQIVHADERLYVVGGCRKDGGVAPIELLDARDGSWLEAVQPILPRKDCGVAMLDGEIYIVGGVSPAGPTATIETCGAEHVLYVHARLLPDA